MPPGVIRKGTDAPGIFIERKDDNVDKPKYSLHLFAGGGGGILADIIDGIQPVCAAVAFIYGMEILRVALKRRKA